LKLWKFAAQALDCKQQQGDIHASFP